MLHNLKYCPFITDNIILLLVCFLCHAISQNKKSLTLHWSINIYSKPIWIGGQYCLSISSCSCRVVGFTRTTPQKLCRRVLSTSLITGILNAVMQTHAVTVPVAVAIHYVTGVNQSTDLRLLVRLWLHAADVHSSLTNNQAEFLNIIPEVMCNVPGKDCVEKSPYWIYVYEIYLIYL